MSQLCIYCDEKDQSKFSGREHVIPQAFGTFGSQTPVLRCVCDTCNAYFGKELDQIHARDTLEGVLRYKQGLFSRENRKQRRLRFTLADESESGEMRGAAVDGVDPTNDRLRPVITQLIILNKQTGRNDIFTRAQLETIALPPEVYGAPGERRLRVFAPTKEEHDDFIEQLNRVGLDMRMEAATALQIWPTVAGDGQETLGVYIEGDLDDLHRRCLAKIFTNFAAHYLSEDEVRKPDWEAVRRFVRHGEGVMLARLSDKPFWSGQETDTMRWPDAINVRLENTGRGLVGVIQFYNRVTYELLLIQGYCVEHEVAARFAAGNDPEFGYRGPVSPSGPTMAG